LGFLFVEKEALGIFCCLVCVRVLEGMITIDYAVGLFAMRHCQHTRHNSGVLLFVEHQQGQKMDSQQVFFVKHQQGQKSHLRQLV